MEVFLAIVLAGGVSLWLVVKGTARTSPAQMPARSRIRRVLVAAMLGATGSFTMACGAFAGHRSYAPAPVVRQVSRPLTQRR